jgi:hypothetical protein
MTEDVTITLERKNLNGAAESGFVNVSTSWSQEQIKHT